MNDDDKTRVIRDKPEPATPAGEQTTRAIPVEGAADADAAPSTDSGLGKDAEEQPRTRIISAHSSDEAEQADADTIELTTGWLVVIEGAGRGCSLEIYTGMNSIGRDPNERIPLDFGDTAISRESHAYIIYDEKQNEFYIQHGGKSNLVRLNEDAVLAPVALTRGDIVEIGTTRLLFVPLCGDDFSWKNDL